MAFTMSTPGKTKHRRRADIVAEINVTPMVDVMLVLLVIFMITAPLLTTGVQVELPQAQAKTIDPDEQEPLVVSVDSAGKYYLNVAQYPERPIDLESLSLRIAAELQRHPKRPVLVRGDKTVAYGEVIKAMVFLQQAGAGTVGLVTDPAETKKS